MTQPTPTECRTCSDWRYAAIVASIEQGATIKQAAEDAGLHPPSVHRHRRSCATYADRLEQAQAKRGKPQSRQGQHQAELSAYRRSRATPRIVEAVANGCSRSEAARRANISPNTESSWYRMQPTYRAAIDQAQAQAGASR